MKLEMITDELCPTCKSITVRDSRKPERHTCGEPFEEREFACGCVLEWSPNFSKLMEKRGCPQDPIRLQEKVRFDKAKVLLVEYAKNLDIDKKDRVRFITQLGYINFD